MKRIIAVIAVACLLGGCATGSEVLVGAKHPPIDPSQVQVYASPPPQPYDQVAILDAQGAGLGPQRQMDSAIAKLKSQAAELGANGILLQGVSGARSTVGFGSYYGSGGTFGTGTFTGIKRAEASATAIYVHQ